MYRFEASFVHPPQPPGWRSVADRVAELERDPQRAVALENARRRIAPILHAERSLAALRMQQGLSQAELARRIGTSQSRLSRIETGMDDPRLSTVVRLAKALGVDLNTLSAALAVSKRDEL